jgi:phosphoribosylanthranilate isomerase
MYRPRVKICCISSIEEARMAIQAGADALGLVADMPSGPGIISDKLIADIARKIPPPIATFLLTSETEAKRIIVHYMRVSTNAIQIVDELTDGTFHEIKKTLPAVKLVQVIHVKDKESVEKAIHVSQFVDAILLDSGNPDLDTKVLGGTGKIHNWKLSKKICRSIDVPVFLAGGINTGNVREALKTVQPFGIDICSGVRTNGKLDRKKLNDLFRLLH